jgi:hypothetical protein
MGTLTTQIPASVKSYLPSASNSTTPNPRFSFSTPTEATRPYLVPERKNRTGSVGKSIFIALAKESEDARITGATRSLDRRLLGLNLRGSKMSVKPVADVMIDIKSA